MTLHEILPKVTKPARYIGNELHSVQKKNPLFKVAIVYPDVYERGMSHFSLRLLYHLLNREEGVQCERVFAPWKDMKECLSREGFPLFSLESHTPLSSFPLILILLHDPLSYPTVLHLLDMAKIPHESLERERGGPILLGGDLPCNNPEPLAPFFDGFWIGDGEEVIPPILKSLKECGVKHIGVHTSPEPPVVQGGMRNSEFGISKEEILSRLSKIEGVYIPRYPKNVRTRIVATLRKEDFPIVPIVPYLEIDRDSLLIEIERHRISRPLEDVMEMVQEGFRRTGWEEVALLSSTNPPFLSEILISLASFLMENHIRLQIPFLHPTAFSEEGIRALKEVQKGPLRLLGNDGCEEDLIKKLESAREEGFQKIHLHFEVDLIHSGPVRERILGILNLSREARKAGGRSVFVTIAPSLPTPHRNGERVTLFDIEVSYEFEKSLRSLSRRMAHNFLVRMKNGEMAHLKGLLFRGDRSYSKVIEGVYRQGGFLETWNEHFSYERWIHSFQEAGLDPREEARRWEKTDRLPWDFILPPEVSNESGVQRVESIKSKDSIDSKDSRLDIPWGRQKRKISSLSPFSKLRLRASFSKGEEVRFLSHLDLIRTIHRALRRSRIPILYSKGFSPRPKVAFGPPLSLGMTGQNEYFDLLLSDLFPLRKISPSDFVFSMNQVLPKGFIIREAIPLPPQSPSLTEILNIGVYRVEGLPCKVHLTHLRPFPPEVLDMKEEEEGVEIVVRMGQGAKVGLKKFLESHFGLSIEEISQCKIERTGLFIQEGKEWKKP